MNLLSISRSKLQETQERGREIAGWVTENTNICVLWTKKWRSQVRTVWYGLRSYTTRCQNFDPSLKRTVCIFQVDICRTKARPLTTEPTMDDKESSDNPLAFNEKHGKEADVISMNDSSKQDKFIWQWKVCNTSATFVAFNSCCLSSDLPKIHSVKVSFLSELFRQLFVELEMWTSLSDLSPQIVD